MVKKIINQFQCVNSEYEKLIKITEEKFISIKTKKEEDIRRLEKEERVHLFDLEEEIEKLKGNIHLFCEQKQIEKKSLNQLIGFMSVEEKEQVMACQETAIHFERKLKNNLKMNECLALAFMETNRAIIETVMHVANEESAGNNLFINEEL